MQPRDLLKRISIVAAVAAVGASGVTSAQSPEDIVVDDLKYISTEADGERVQLTPAKFNAHSETSDLIKMTDDAFSFFTISVSVVTRDTSARVGAGTAAGAVAVVEFLRTAIFLALFGDSPGVFSV
jgi:hypothetical protein